jgi:hypothetical protein
MTVALMNSVSAIGLHFDHFGTVLAFLRLDCNNERAARHN